MRGTQVVSPILMAFVRGYGLHDLADAIESGRGVHGATDLWAWIVVPVAGLAELFGIRRAFATPRSTPTPE